MKRLTIVLVVAATALAFYSQVFAFAGKNANGQTPIQTSALQIPFVENSGQLDDEIAYSTQTRWGAYHVMRSGEILLDLRTPGSGAIENHILKENFEGAHVTRVRGEQAGPTKVNYYMGSEPERWWENVKTYGAVSLGEIYPGIELMLRSYRENVEKLFIVEPGGDPSKIRIRVQGADLLDTAGDGKLLVMTPSGPLYFTRPVAYQFVGEGKIDVAVGYRTAGDTYTFEIGKYDSSRELVIDPLISTYLGGESLDYGNAIAVTGTGDSLKVYVTGSTQSDSIPGFAGTYGGTDVFVANLNAYLTTLLNATYIGGSGDESGEDLVVQPVTGDIFITGTTNSLNLSGAAGTAPGSSSSDPGNENVFLVHLDEDLQVLDPVFAVYLGDDEDNLGYAMDLHDVAGTTIDFIYVAGRWSRSNNKDAFVTRMFTSLAEGATQFYTGYGGSEAAYDVASYTSPAGTVTVYVVGTTTAGTESDAFITAWDQTLGFIGETNVGGPGVAALEFGMAVAVHPSTGDVYIAGGTGESVYGSIFPGATGAQTTFGGQQDAFVARLPGNLSGVVNATYLGGAMVDRAHDLEIYPPDLTGEVFVLGYTKSSDFPDTTGGLQPTGSSETFAARLSTDLSTVHQATYLGGSGVDESMGNCLSITEDCCFTWAYVAGSTESGDFPGLTNDVVQENFGGSVDAFVARLDATLAPNTISPDIEVQPRSHDFGDTGPYTPVEISISNMGGWPLIIGSMSITGSSEFSFDVTGGSTPCNASNRTLNGGDSCTVEVSFIPAVGGSHSGSFDIATDDPDENLVEISLSATAATVEPEINISPTAVSIGSIEVGSRGVGSFTINNIGTGTLQVDDIAMVADSNFTLILGGISPNCTDPPFSLDSGAMCSVVLWFEPVSVGTHNHSVTVTSDDSDEATVVVPLSGTGTAGGGGGGGGGGCSTVDDAGTLDDWSTGAGITLALFILLLMRWKLIRKRS